MLSSAQEGLQVYHLITLACSMTCALVSMYMYQGLLGLHVHCLLFATSLAFRQLRTSCSDMKQSLTFIGSCRHSIMPALDSAFGKCAETVYLNLWCGVVWCGVVWCGVVWCGMTAYIVW